jgi:Protein of unknown function (DUF2752)
VTNNPDLCHQDPGGQAPRQPQSLRAATAAAIRSACIKAVIDSRAESSVGSVVPPVGAAVPVGRLRSAPYRAAVLTTAAVGADVAFDPTHTRVPLCPFHAVTGMWCPLCGCLRAAYSMTRLDVGAALHDNALFVAALPILALFWVDWIVRARSGLPRRRLSRATNFALMAGAVVFAVVRNLPFAAALRPR